MANINAPFGFRPVRRKDGADWTQSIEYRQIKSDDTTAIFRNDMIAQLNTGYITRAVATTKPFLGIFLGCEYYDTALQDVRFSPWWPGVSTALAGSIKAKIIRDPNVIFQVQSVGSAAITIADIGANTDAINGSGNTLNGLSTQGLDQSLIGPTTATLQWQIFDFAPILNNDNALANNIVEVCMVNVTDRTLTGL